MHVTRIDGTVERGVRLVIIPLLALSTDQLAKFKEGNQDYGTIEAHHMDEVVKESRAKVAGIMHRIRRLRRDTTSTVFIICSPQFFVHNPAFTKTIVEAGGRRILRLVVIDEVHLYVQHGTLASAQIYGNSRMIYLPKYSIQTNHFCIPNDFGNRYART